jgi:hypothetical protein
MKKIALYIGGGLLGLWLLLVVLSNLHPAKTEAKPEPIRHAQPKPVPKTWGGITEARLTSTSCSRTSASRRVLPACYRRVSRRGSRRPEAASQNRRNTAGLLSPHEPARALVAKKMSDDAKFILGFG